MEHREPGPYLNAHELHIHTSFACSIETMSKRGLNWKYVSSNCGIQLKYLWLAGMVWVWGGLGFSFVECWISKTDVIYDLVERIPLFINLLSIIAFWPNNSLCNVFHQHVWSVKRTALFSRILQCCTKKFHVFHIMFMIDPHPHHKRNLCLQCIHSLLHMLIYLLKTNANVSSGKCIYNNNPHDERPVIRMGQACSTKAILPIVWTPSAWVEFKRMQLHSYPIRFEYNVIISYGLLP